MLVVVDLEPVHFGEVEFDVEPESVAVEDDRCRLPLLEE